MNKRKKFVNIYTDGACSGNQNAENLGGWGAILEYGQHIKESYGGEKNTTNNRMELTALAEALEMLTRDGLSINVFSDSSYLIRCMNEKWYEKWKNNDWKNSNKKPVENRDLWERIISQLLNHNFKFYHVKGHVNLQSENIDLDNLYRKFIDKNGDVFSIKDFRYITEMNNRADALANNGIDTVRE